MPLCLLPPGFPRIRATHDPPPTCTAGCTAAPILSSMPPLAAPTDAEGCPGGTGGRSGTERKPQPNPGVRQRAVVWTFSPRQRRVLSYSSSSSGTSCGLTRCVALLLFFLESPSLRPRRKFHTHRLPHLPLPPAACRLSAELGSYRTPPHASLPKSPTLHHFPSARLKAPPGACGVGLRTRPALAHAHPHAEAEKKNPPTTSPAAAACVRISPGLLWDHRYPPQSPTGTRGRWPATRPA